jgi:hypothetical protein
MATLSAKPTAKTTTFRATAQLAMATAMAVKVTVTTRTVLVLAAFELVAQRVSREAFSAR